MSRFSVTQEPDRSTVSVLLSLLWVFGRVFLLLAVVYLFRRPLLDAVEMVFDIIGITEFAIDRASTPLTRLVVVACFGAGYFMVATACARFFPRHAYVVSVAVAALPTAVFSWKAESGMAAFGVVIALLVANWARLSTLKRLGLGNKILGCVIAFPPAVAEVFLASRFMDWVRSRLHREASAGYAEVPRLLPGALIAALALASLTPGKKLIRYEQALRSGSDVRQFATGDFNDIVFVARDNRLLVTGHGVSRVLGFDVADLTKRPIKADVKTGFAQAFEFNSADEELYVYNGATRKILVLGARDLTLKRAIDAPDISPGDPWIKYCPLSDTLTIASEADEQKGNPFVVFDRASGKVLDKLDLEAGNLLKHPDKPILYANFFRRVCGVVAYDLKTRSIVAKAPTDARTDRMAYDPVHGELLMASPAEGRIQRFDALTLEPKGAFKAIAGARNIVVDEANGVMLVASLLTGKVAMMGLKDHEVKREWYLGPWLRSVVIAPGTGTAYVSSQKSLYELHYRHGD